MMKSLKILVPLFTFAFCITGHAQIGMPIPGAMGTGNQQWGSGMPMMNQGCPYASNGKPQAAKEDPVEKDELVSAVNDAITEAKDKLKEAKLKKGEAELKIRQARTALGDVLLEGNSVDDLLAATKTCRDNVNNNAEFDSSNYLDKTTPEARHTYTLSKISEFSDFNNDDGNKARCTKAAFAVAATVNASQRFDYHGMCLANAGSVPEFKNLHGALNNVKDGDQGKCGTALNDLLVGDAALEKAKRDITAQNKALKDLAKELTSAKKEARENLDAAAADKDPTDAGNAGVRCATCDAARNQQTPGISKTQEALMIGLPILAIGGSIWLKHREDVDAERMGYPSSYSPYGNNAGINVGFGGGGGGFGYPYNNGMYGGTYSGMNAGAFGCSPTMAQGVNPWMMNQGMINPMMMGMPGMMSPFGSPFGGSPFGSPFGGSPFGSPFGGGFGSPFGGGRSPFGSPFGGSPFGGSPFGGSPFGSPFGGSPFGSPFGGSPFGGSPFGSPFGGSQFGSPFGGNSAMMYQMQMMQMQQMEMQQYQARLGIYTQDMTEAYQLQMAAYNTLYGGGNTTPFVGSPSMFGSTFPGQNYLGTAAGSPGFGFSISNNSFGGSPFGASPFGVSPFGATSVGSPFGLGSVAPGR